jgi:hypothetical protein
MSFLKNFFNKLKVNFFYNCFNNINYEITIKNTLKYYFLFNILPKKKKYNIVECGVGAGESLSFIVLIAKLLKIDFHVWAFDSFEGFPNATLEDKGKYAPGKIKPIYMNYNINFVKTRMKKYGLTEEDINKNVTFVKGFFPESFVNYNKKSIDLLHLDVDLYNSYKSCLSFFWPFLDIKSIILLDEYKSISDLRKWPGASKAIDEFFEEKKINLSVIQQEPIFKKYYFIKNE